jgi:transcriptional regulator with XRE-family HTH domain
MEKPPSSLDERTGFSDRLKMALAEKKLSTRPSYFARAFNARAGGRTVTAHAARKWLIGEAIPTQDRILVLAKWLNVNAAWLRFGEEASNELLNAQGLESVLLTKDESELVQGMFALSTQSRAVVQGLVESLLRMEESDVPKKKRAQGSARKKAAMSTQDAHRMDGAAWLEQGSSNIKTGSHKHD